jgi:hypothetical protein
MSHLFLKDDPLCVADNAIDDDVLVLKDALVYVCDDSPLTTVNKQI